MKYFIDVTIIDLKTNNVAQKMDYDVNFADDATVTIESVKSELSQWVTIPRDKVLINEKTKIKGSIQEDSAVVSDKTRVYYTAHLQQKVKDQK
jgi:ribosomal protein S24E